MPPLSSDLRNQLASTIKAARREGEAGARKVLESLAVHNHKPHGSMSKEEGALRNRLRAHGRQLGDVRDRTRGTQETTRLAHEVAYEHWHRMLFSRFLAENGLLIEPDSGVAITTDECEELAREAGEDPRAMAARFAQKALPQIFRPDDPVLELTLTPETRQALDKLLDNLPPAVFTADDSLGWTYQYWQAEKKDEVNKSGNKIGADELPAVTQLFTEHYMVLFLYHNTIGAWHAGKVLSENPSLTETARSEQELRQAVRLRSQGGYDFEYLRFVRELREGDEEDTPTGPWRPAAGTFEGWPKSAKELKVLDPCCGSGHFLTEGFELLVRLRIDEEGLDLEDAIRGILADNLHGLEIDPRCTQIAAFNLAIAAWKLVGKPIELPTLHIACSGLAVGSSRKEWTALAGETQRLRIGMERLYDLFEQAPELGSLIDPKALRGDLIEANFAELQPLLEQALTRESDDVEGTERAVAAQGMALAAELLAAEYTLAITNVPYLGRGQQSDSLKSFADDNYEETKADLATIFVERLPRWLSQKGTAAAVTPQNWLFLKSYQNARANLLSRRSLDAVALLGSNAFQVMNWWAATTALLVWSSQCPAPQDRFLGMNVGADKCIANKQSFLRSSIRVMPPQGVRFSTGELVGPLHLSQKNQQRNPDSRIVVDPHAGGTLLLEQAKCLAGVLNGDSPRFQRHFWQIWDRAGLWSLQQTTVSEQQEFGGHEKLILFDETGGHLREEAWVRRDRLHDSDRRGNEAWGRQGVAVSQTGFLPVSFYTGEKFDSNVAVVLPADPSALLAIWCFCASDEFAASVRSIDQKLNVTNASLGKVPFDLDHWQRVAAEKYSDGLPEPQSDEPTQWLFHGHPASTEPATALQVAVGRMLGYRWPPELDPEMRLANEAREWVARCDALTDFADEDGIVCLSATRGERSAGDRLRRLLSAAFGSEWSAAKERELLAAAGDGKKPAASLEGWLRDKFFEEHCKLFHHRPFVWHIWDGNKGGFHVLVSAHKLTGPDGEGRRTLEAITYSYLGDWIDRQKADQRDGKEGADARLAAAQDLQGQLEKILNGEPPYDLFVRWKPLHEQAIGWEPDINDGVRLNIRPFMKAELRKGGKKGAGILRWKPNVKWKKDRGKEPQSLRPKAEFPWFWGCPGDGSVDERTGFRGGSEFDGNRWNDLHHTIAAKRAVRAELAELADHGGAS